MNGNAGAAIAAYRRHAGLSRRYLAYRTGYSVHTVKNVEQGQRRATDEFLAAVAPVLMVHVEQLTGKTS